MPLPRLILPWNINDHIGDGVDGLTGTVLNPAIDRNRSNISSEQVLLTQSSGNVRPDYFERSLTDATTYVAGHGFHSHMGASGGYSMVKASVKGKRTRNCYEIRCQ